MAREEAGEATVNPDFDERRAQARARLDALDPHKRLGGGEADPKRRDWFEAVYRLAENDAAGVPWAQLEPHPLLAEWLAGHRLDGLRALDVGCGLGDKAEALAAAGAKVVAFDLVAGAVDWAQRRFPRSSVDYRAADLFDLPADWRGAFELTHECYTLQALPESLLIPAARALAATLAPGGRLLVIARARDDADLVEGPPWPLTRRQIEALAVDGLRLTRLEEAMTLRSGPHWRAVFSQQA
jgi:2-polyprenyl-3-methyl-5-hydroxy-6-metoxy-1,4-benzoquinol methylase